MEVFEISHHTSTRRKWAMARTRLIRIRLPTNNTVCRWSMVQQLKQYPVVNLIAARSGFYERKLRSVNKLRICDDRICELSPTIVIISEAAKLLKSLQRWGGDFRLRIYKIILYDYLAKVSRNARNGVNGHWAYVNKTNCGSKFIMYLVRSKDPKKTS